MKVPLFESGDVYLCRNIDEWNNVFRSLNLSDDIQPDIVGRSTVFRNESGHCLYLIGIFNGSMATLSHESAHTAFNICNDVGVDVKPGLANETFCYLLTRLVEFGEKHIKNHSV